MDQVELSKYLSVLEEMESLKTQLAQSKSIPGSSLDNSQSEGMSQYP